MSAFVILDNMGTDVSTAQITSNGHCGSNATYNIYSDGTLEIIGSGEMDQYDTTHAPWYGCREDITKIIISDQITKLGVSAFLDCKNIIELTIPITLNSVVSDSNPVFSGCSNIEKINFTSGDGGFGYNYAAYPVSNSWYQNTPWYQSRDILKVINFADGVKGIGSDAFRELNLSSIVLPDSVVHLGNHCFFNCTKLTDLTIPISLNPYGSEEKYPSFHGCMAVQKVSFTKGNGIPFDYCGWMHNSSDNANLAPWNMNSAIEKTIIIADDITVTGDFMFEGCNIKEVTVPISMLAMNYNAFCPPYNNLTDVTITQGTGVGEDFYSKNGTHANFPWSEAPNLKTVTVEEGVTYIGTEMFYSCSMQNLILPNSLTSFGYTAFQKCTIKNLTIPISVNATWFDEHPAFTKVSGIEKINFTPGSGYGFDYAAYEVSNCWYHHTPWYQCRGTLKEINFAEGIKHIGSDAFRELHLTSIVIPNSVESLGCHAFYNISDLSSLSVPITLDCVASNQYPAFQGCVNIEKMTFTGSGNWFGYGDSDSQPSCYWYAPWHLSNSVPKTVGLSNGVPYIANHVFEGSTSLKSIIISDSVKTIDSSAFAECTNLTTIILGSSVESIGEGAFSGCTSLTSFAVSDDNHAYTSIDDVLYSNDKTTLIHYPTGKSGTSFETPASVKVIRSYAFSGCTSLTSVTISDSVVTIEDGAFDITFYDIDGVKKFEPTAEILAGSTFDDIGGKWVKQKEFGKCGDNVTYELDFTTGTLMICGTGVMNNFSFSMPPWYTYRDSILSINIGGSVSSIGNYALANCASLATVTFSNSVSSIGIWAFNGCISLTSVTLPDSVTSIGAFAFCNCSSLTTVIIPSSVTSIGDYAFYGCMSLNSVNVPNSVTSIGDHVFDGKFFNTDIETEFALTVQNLAVFKFNKISQAEF